MVGQVDSRDLDFCSDELHLPDGDGALRSIECHLAAIYRSDLDHYFGGHHAEREDRLGNWAMVFFQMIGVLVILIPQFQDDTLWGLTLKILVGFTYALVVLSLRWMQRF